MKHTYKLSSLLAQCAAAVLLAGAAHAQGDRGPYFKTDLGGAMTETTDLRSFIGPVAPGSKVEFDPGVRFGMAAGWRWMRFFSTEAEIGVMESGISSMTGVSVHDAYMYNTPILFNARGDFPLPFGLSVYGGAGIGYSSSVFDAGHSQSGFTTVHGTDWDSVFAWQAFAGLRWSFGGRMGLSVEYRYFHADPTSWDIHGGPGGPGGSIGFGQIQTHAVSLAFDVRF